MRVEEAASLVFSASSQSSQCQAPINSQATNAESLSNHSQIDPVTLIGRSTDAAVAVAREECAELVALQASQRRRVEMQMRGQ